MEPKGNIRVFCRVQRLTSKGLISYNAINEPTALKLQYEGTEKSYQMDEFLSPSLSQEEVSVCYFSC